MFKLQPAGKCQQQEASKPGCPNFAVSVAGKTIRAMAGAALVKWGSRSNDGGLAKTIVRSAAFGIKKRVNQADSG
jgi:hypothetical protein